MFRKKDKEISKAPWWVRLFFSRSSSRGINNIREKIPRGDEDIYVYTLFSDLERIISRVERRRLIMFDLSKVEAKALVTIVFIIGFFAILAEIIAVRPEFFVNFITVMQYPLLIVIGWFFFGRDFAKYISETLKRAATQIPAGVARTVILPPPPRSSSSSAEQRRGE